MQVYIPRDFFPASAWAIISLGDASPRPSSDLPGTEPPSRSRPCGGYLRERAIPSRPQTVSSLLGLAPGGGCLATRITAGAGGLLHHRFTITHPLRGRLSVSVALLRQITPPRDFPGTALYGVRTFLGAVRHTAPRPPGQPEGIIIIQIFGTIVNSPRALGHITEDRPLA